MSGKAGMWVCAIACVIYIVTFGVCVWRDNNELQQCIEAVKR